MKMVSEKRQKQWTGSCGDNAPLLQTEAGTKVKCVAWITRGWGGLHRIIHCVCTHTRELFPPPCVNIGSE